jgi:chemotaxis protein methyltransferase CheR/two-component system CheB/CheR fusion protein
MRPFISTRAPELLVAGIGASAGGIEAMLPMLAHLPRTGRIAYVVAQHMADNGHSDLVARLLGRESTLPVILAKDGERLAADTVYVIPAGKDGHLRNGTLDLQAPGAANISTPSINTLFTSISQAKQKNAIGIILSGTGADGTAGCRAIRNQGGLTFAQDTAEAKFNGMPSAAIEAAAVDHVLPVKLIGEALAARFPAIAPLPVLAPIAASTAGFGPIEATIPGIDTQALRDLEKILRRVHEATGIDFSSYKEETLLRRLDKRKSTLGISNPEDYLAFINRQPAELKTLQELFLVSVTAFFRDPASFRELQRALACLLTSKPDGDPIRIWVPGCASGDECYSLAIILKEMLTPYGKQHPVQITGTDLNPEALTTARAGIYRQTALRDVPDGLREQYFIAHGQHFEVAASLKECVTFEQRDVLSVLPPDALDLVSCRNLLIYMKSSLQDQLIKNFHRALRPQGLLFVGQSESLSFLGNSLFFPIDHFHRLYRRRH